jgi:hypothetical protein
MSGVDAPRIAYLEYTVSDLEPCIRFFGLMGLELVGPSRHPVLDADVAQVWAGPLAINLLRPTDTGQGIPITDPEPHMSQVTFVMHEDDALHRLRHRLIEGGAAVFDRHERLFFVDPHMIGGLLGSEVSFVFCTEETAVAGENRATGGQSEDADPGR